MAAQAHTGQDPRATPENWMFPPEEGWTWDQVKELDVPFYWELLDGNIVVRGATTWWHDRVRNELYFQLRSAQRPPYGTEVERWTQFDDNNVPKPDIVVYDKTGIDIRTLDCTPVACVVLAVEVVSPGLAAWTVSANPACTPRPKSPITGESSAARTMFRWCTSSGATRTAGSSSPARPARPHRQAHHCGPLPRRHRPPRSDRT